MPTASKAVLKSYFLTGSKPTQLHFASLIDSFVHNTEGGESAGGTVEKVLPINAAAPVLQPAGTLTLAPGQTIMCSIFFADAAGGAAYLKAVFSYLSGTLSIALLDKLLTDTVADVALTAQAGGIVEIRPALVAGSARGTIRVSGTSVQS